MHATIFGNVAPIVGRMYARRAGYDKKVARPPDRLQVLDLEHFARIHQLPGEVRRRMQDHLQTKWFFNRGLDSKVSPRPIPGLRDSPLGLGGGPFFSRNLFEEVRR